MKNTGQTNNITKEVGVGGGFYMCVSEGEHGTPGGSMQELSARTMGFLPPLHRPP